MALFRERGCHPLSNLISLPLLVPPMILSIFAAIDNLALSEPSMALEGALWFPSLLAADSTHLLPIISAATWLANLEVGAGRAYHESRTVRDSTRMAAAMCWPLASNLPSGVLIFWIASNAFAVGRGYVMRLDPLRRRLGIPLAKVADHRFGKVNAYPEDVLREHFGDA